MYDNRWLCFTHWAAGQGIDLLGPTAAQIAAFLYYLFHTQGLSPQSIKGYRPCLMSVLSPTGMAAAVQAKMMQDMITSMEFQRPRMTPVLPQWDLDIILQALSKTPYLPLREACPRHYTRNLEQDSLSIITGGLSWSFDLGNSLPPSHGFSRKTQRTTTFSVWSTVYTIQT